jgi:hypothetical protein
MVLLSLFGIPGSLCDSLLIRLGGTMGEQAMFLDTREFASQQLLDRHSVSRHQRGSNHGTQIFEIRLKGCEAGDA